MYSYIDDVDLPFDTPNETFEQMLEKLAREVPSAFVKLMRFKGSGGGWPQAEVIVKTQDLRKFFEFFGFDESDVEWAISQTTPLP